MHTRGKQSAGRSVRRPTKLRTPGGTLPRRIRGLTLVVCTCFRQLRILCLTSYLVAVQALAQTITHLTKAGRFRQAADREKEIGQIYLQELNDLRKACESYERAAEWYTQEDANAYVANLRRAKGFASNRPYDSTANACYKDAADLHAELEDYPQAIALYEQVGNGSLSSPLTKYSVKEYWLRASLCALAMKVRRGLSCPFQVDHRIESFSVGYRYCKAQLVEIRLSRYHLPVDQRG